MKKLFMTGAASAAMGLFLAASAHAADLYTPPPPAPPVIAPTFTWAGPYVGGQIGYGWGEGKVKDTDEEFDPDGIVGGGFLGYNFAFGRHFVLGLEGDFNGSGFSDKYDDDGSHKFEEQFFGTVRARLGYGWHRTLLYVAGGWAYSRAKFEFEGVKDKHWHNGWTIGGGIDHAFTHNLFGRIEYRYTDYGTEKYEVAPNHRLDYKDHKVLVGVGWKF